MATVFTRKQIAEMPSYVTINGHSHLRLYNPEMGGFGGSENLREYYRDAGHWHVDIRIDETNGKYYSVSTMEHLHNIELVPCTYAAWKKDNGNYATGDKSHSIKYKPKKSSDQLPY